MMTPKQIARTRDIMIRLEEQIGQTIGLGALVAESGYGQVLAEVAGTSGFTYHLTVGYQFPLHTAAPGKAMMAYLSKKERDRHYAHMDFKRYTPSTITNRADFDAELEAVVEKGYSVDVSEELEGCQCVGVPVFDAAHTIAAALWTTGPSSKVPVRSFDKIADIMKKASQEITQNVYTTGRSHNRDHINSIIEQACEIMQNNLHRPIDIRELAKNLYVSYSWFRQVFKEQTGTAPLEYHVALRIKKAEELLHDTELSIRRISEELGFKSQNHFSALFKQKTGLSPMNYRES